MRITLDREASISDRERTNSGTARGDIFGLMVNVYRSSPFTLNTLLTGGDVTYRSSATPEQDRNRQEDKDGGTVEAVMHDGSHRQREIDRWAPVSVR